MVIALLANSRRRGGRSPRRSPSFAFPACASIKRTEQRAHLRRHRDIGRGDPAGRLEGREASEVAQIFRLETGRAGQIEVGRKGQTRLDDPALARRRPVRHAQRVDRRGRQPPASCLDHGVAQPCIAIEGIAGEPMLGGADRIPFGGVDQRRVEGVGRGFKRREIHRQARPGEWIAAIARSLVEPGACHEAREIVGVRHRAILYRRRPSRKYRRWRRIASTHEPTGSPPRPRSQRGSGT